MATEAGGFEGSLNLDDTIGMQGLVGDAGCLPIRAGCIRMAELTLVVSAGRSLPPMIAAVPDV